MVELNTNIDNINAALDLDDAFKLINSLRAEKQIFRKDEQSEKLKNESEENLDSSQD